MYTYKTNKDFSHRNRFNGSVALFFRLSLIFFILTLLVRFFEIAYFIIKNGSPLQLFSITGSAIYHDFIYFLKIDFWLAIFFYLIYYFSKKIAYVFYIICSVILLLTELGLIWYFLSAFVPLGADLFGYSLIEIKQTAGASGSLNLSSLFSFIVLITIILLAFKFLFRSWTPPLFLGVGFCILLLLSIFLPLNLLIRPTHFKDDFQNNLVLNKNAFFIHSSEMHFFPPDNDIDIYADSFIGISDENRTSKEIWSYPHIGESEFPFLHKDSLGDVLAPFFRVDSSQKPNIVILIVEGLGRAFTNEDAYLGNFTPFIDSLSKSSLYWPNFLSEGGRTFAVLPSILGSLPFGQHGFDDLGNAMPAQNSLASILNYNGYTSSFFYGGDAHFDNMETFIKKQGPDPIYDQNSFGQGYIKMPANSSGSSWGYGDQELFRHYFEILAKHNSQPYLNILLTLSTHSPFLINNQNFYLQKFEKRMSELQLSDMQKRNHADYKMQFASILFMDDAIRAFFKAYSTRPDYKHTIFFITGDHRMPEIPMSTKIDRYHVPLIIFSPLLTRNAVFQSISTHFDITPSLLSFLKHAYNIKVPSLASWMGTGLDTSRLFRNMHAYPLIQTKDGVSDFIQGNFLLHGSELYQITPDMGLVPSDDKKEQSALTNSYNDFINKNNNFIKGAKLIPDSIYENYRKK